MQEAIEVEKKSIIYTNPKSIRILIDKLIFDLIKLNQVYTNILEFMSLFLAFIVFKMRCAW